MSYLPFDETRVRIWRKQHIVYDRFNLGIFEEERLAHNESQNILL